MIVQLRLCALLLLMIGCIDDPTIECGDHRCPADKVCTLTSCATSEEVAACVGIEDHLGCTTRAISIGACGEGACHAVVCGDGITDGPEACDDGNLAAGDGCAALCDSNESCGNGVVDTVDGESCDDGTLGRSQDGCSSTCQTEIAIWTEITPRSIGARAFAGTAYDSVRERVVLFGGESAEDISGDTWEWDANSELWHRRFPARSPLLKTG